MTKGQKAYAEYLSTPYWKEVSRLVKMRANNRCQVCNSDKNLEAHHRTYKNRGNELKNLGDLICLCHNCHSHFHQKTQPQRGESKRQKKARLKKEKMLSSRNSPLPDGQVKMTKELLNSCRTDRLGFTTKSILALCSDASSGWKKRIIGTMVDSEKIRMARYFSDRSLKNDPETSFNGKE